MRVLTQSEIDNLLKNLLSDSTVLPEAQISDSPLEVVNKTADATAKQLFNF